MFEFRIQKATRSRLLAILVAPSFWVTGTVNAGQYPDSWRVDPIRSSLTFTTVKSSAAGVGGVIENLRFNRYEGGLDEMGHIKLNIDLSSVDSGIPLRDERMQSLLWDVKAYPSVTFSAQLGPELRHKVGKEAQAITLDGKLEMAGQSKSIAAELQVVPMNGRLFVSTRKPILVRAEDFGLERGVEALRAIMGLNYIATTVPVTFQLELVDKSEK